jgi:CSLREA domain-containing protein
VGERVATYNDAVALQPKSGTKEIRTMQTLTTTKIKRYFGALAVLAVIASMLAVMSSAEPAHATTTITVNLTDDRADANPGDGTCSVVNFGAFCTLRAAIQEANATAGPDTIDFNINTTGDGIATISPDTALPPITQSVTIDGYTQPGASPNTKTVGDDAVLKVQLDGSKVPGVIGLEINTSNSSVIKGLAINRFATGISIGGDSIANRIEGNFIGTDPTGTLDRGNFGSGVVLGNGSSETVVGGDALAARNVLSGNDSGALIFSSSFNRIQGNYVGTDKSGTKDLGNRFDGSSSSSRPTPPSGEPPPPLETSSPPTAKTDSCSNSRTAPGCWATA